MSYRIKSVASLTGVAATTLRAWERRYDLVAPQRTESGYRIYSDADVARLSQVKALVDRGYKVGEAAEMLRRGTPVLPPSDIDCEALVGFRRELLAGLLQLDRSRSARAYDRLATLPFDRQLDEVLLPLMREVGELWCTDEISVAHEHFCSMFVRARLGAMLETLADGSRGGSEVVCAGLPGERHEFGLMAAGIHLALRGWRVDYFGPDLPIADLAAVLGSRPPRLVCASLILPRPERECLSLMQALRKAVPPDTAVVVGGEGIARGLPGNPFANTYFVRSLKDLFRTPPVRSH